MRAARPAAAALRPIRRNGAFTFAEHPGLAAPDARIIWHADLDPGTLQVVAMPAQGADPDHVEVARLARWLAIATDRDGHEHAVLSDGWHHIRLDIEAGSLADCGRVLLHYQLKGLASARARLLPLRRFLTLAQHHHFAASLFPHDRRIERWLTLLRVHDARRAGASQREIARVLFGEERVDRDWDVRSDSLRSRVRRLVEDARAMARGGYRQLLRTSGRRDDISSGSD